MANVITISYKWILKNVEEEPTTISSEMILFRGKPVFRIYLKNQDNSRYRSPLLFFVAVNLQTVGMKVYKIVFCCKQNEDQCEMEQLKKEDYREENLQLFTAKLDKMITGDCVLAFHIQIDGSIPLNYSYQLCDRLSKNQLWECVKNEKLSDVELIVKDKKFFLHKAILSARSQVFAAMFADFKSVQQLFIRIQINDVNPLIMEEFLYFLYTGEPMKSLANEELLELASRFDLGTLVDLCKAALTEINVEQILSLKEYITPSIYELGSSLKSVQSVYQTEFNHDSTISTFLCHWELQIPPYSSPKENIAPKTFYYQSKTLFTARIQGDFNDYRVSSNGESTTGERKLKLITLVGLNHPGNGYQIVKVSCFSHQTSTNSTEVSKPSCKWIKMKRRSGVEDDDLLHPYYGTMEYNQSLLLQHIKLNFCIKMKNMVENYRHEMMDTKWKTQLWSAAKSGHLTDVQVSVGLDRFFVHRIILSARSQVFNSLLENETNGKKSEITLDETYDYQVVRKFFKYLYTGSLDIPANNKQLLLLAENYEINTLVGICKGANQVPDEDDITSSFFAAK